MAEEAAKRSRRSQSPFTMKEKIMEGGGKIGLGISAERLGQIDRATRGKNNETNAADEKKDFC